MFARSTSQAFARPTLVYARPNANDTRDAKKRTARHEEEEERRRCSATPFGAVVCIYLKITVRTLH